MIKINALTKKDLIAKMQVGDQYVEELSQMNIDMSYAMHSKQAPKINEYLSHVVPLACADLLENDIERVSKIEDKMNTNIDEIGLIIDEEINFGRNTGVESFGMAYTRNNTVVIPVDEPPISTLGYLGAPLIAHELFHILTRKYPHIRNALYQAVGFNEATIEIPRVMRDSLIINPDAMRYGHYINLIVDGESIRGVPYIGVEDGGFRFDLILVLDIEKDGVLTSSGRVVSSAETNMSSIIKNVSYRSHPEEICAEHFRMLLTGAPAIDVKMAELFKEVITTELKKIAVDKSLNGSEKKGADLKAKVR